VADYENSKPGTGAVYPINAVDSDWKRNEPLITAQRLRNKQLWGIPLVSGQKDPTTKRAQVMDDPTINDFIETAVANIELELGGIHIFPIQFEEKYPLDPQELQSYGYFRLKNRPVSSIEYMAVSPANDIDIYEVPNEWFEMTNIHQGQLNIQALGPVVGSSSIPTAGGGGGSWFLNFFSHGFWMPAFFKIRYTCGFPDGEVPKTFNDLIGTAAAMDILSVLASTKANSSGGSLGIDGMSQSISTPGPELYRTRLEELEKKKYALVKRIKAYYGTSLFSGNV
jgi:hypothetical protein